MKTIMVLVLLMQNGEEQRLDIGQIFLGPQVCREVAALTESAIHNQFGDSLDAVATDAVVICEERPD